MVLRQSLGWFLSYHWKALFLRGFILQPTERAQVLLKKSTRDFQNSHVTISGNFESFQYLNFETVFFGKRKPFSKKVESIKIENASFPYKTAILEANFKTNGMMSTKWTHHKERSFASNYFIFMKILFQFKNLLQRVDLMHQRSKCPYS